MVTKGISELRKAWRMMTIVCRQLGFGRGDIILVQQLRAWRSARGALRQRKRQGDTRQDQVANRVREVGASRLKVPIQQRLDDGQLAVEMGSQRSHSPTTDQHDAKPEAGHRQTWQNA